MLLDRLKFFIVKFIKDNKVIFFLLIALTLVGICLGAFGVNMITHGTKEFLINYINNFFAIISNDTFEPRFILKSSIKNNIFPIAILFLSSITFLGTIFSPLYIVFRGFCLGFAIAFLTENFGDKGLLLTLSSLLPQNIIYLPAIVFACLISMEFSLKMLRHKKESFYDRKNRKIASYLTCASIALIFFFAACIVEAYITPIFIKAVHSYL